MILHHIPFQSSHPASWRTPVGSLKSGYWGTVKIWWTSHWSSSLYYWILNTQELKPNTNSPYLITISGGIFMPALVQKCALFLKHIQEEKCMFSRKIKWNDYLEIHNATCILSINHYQVLLVSCVRPLFFSMHVLHLLNSFQFVLIYNTERVNWKQDSILL